MTDINLEDGTRIRVSWERGGHFRLVSCRCGATEDDTESLDAQPCGVYESGDPIVCPVCGAVYEGQAFVTVNFSRDGEYLASA